MGQLLEARAVAIDPPNAAGDENEVRALRADGKLRASPLGGNLLGIAAVRVDAPGGQDVVVHRLIKNPTAGRPLQDVVSL